MKYLTFAFPNQTVDVKYVFCEFSNLNNSVAPKEKFDEKNWGKKLLEMSL